MGANTSKPGATKESLYELLNVSSDADASTLKKAYRQRALELHPDRNFSNVEEATAMFAKVQAAYDLLTDPQEREWYDQHRRNRDYNEYDGDITTAADVRAATTDVVSRSTLDFEMITTYFEKLKHEEQEAAFEQGIEAPASIVYAPGFGSVHDSWVQTRVFYDNWSTFNTIKSYNWEDIYPIHAAHDRRTRRKFEQANKKVRDASKREFSAAVKQALLLLRQRDPRRPAETQKDKSKQEELAAKEHAKRVERNRKLREDYTDQDWQKPEEDDQQQQLEGQLQQLQLSNSRNAGQQLQQNNEPAECFVCESTFETEFDLQDHYKTNKHKRVVEALKVQMMREDELINGPKPELDEDQKKAQEQSRPVKQGKAKAKAKKKQQGQYMLVCGTCGQEFAGPELMAHKKETRHP